MASVFIMNQPAVGGVIIGARLGQSAPEYLWRNSHFYRNGRKSELGKNGLWDIQRKKDVKT
jgi:hypothetical protein